MRPTKPNTHSINPPTPPNQQQLAPAAMRKFAFVALLGLVAAHQAAAFVPAMPAARAAPASRTGALLQYA